MFRSIYLSMAVAACMAAPASAQVVVRVPFVRVETGGPGTYVRAPFVNLFIPSGPPPGYYYGPPAGIYMGPPPPFAAVPPNKNSSVATLPQPRVAPQALPPGPVEAKSASPAPANPDVGPPPPAQAPKAPTLDEFAKAFKPKAGNYELTLTNPVSGKPETVRFSLPGDPQRVRTTATTIEFEFGSRRFVRIEFDQDGPMVISR